MNELQIFNYHNGKVKVISKRDVPLKVVLGNEVLSKYELLALAGKVADEDIKSAWELLNLASIIFHPYHDWAFNELYKSVAFDLTRNKSFSLSEYAIHGYFKENHKTILGNEYSLKKIKTNGKDIPDAWVKYKSELIPVEVKKSEFDKKALKQLLRYMSSYNCGSGIAIGRELSVDIPQNIKFISCKGWCEK